MQILDGKLTSQAIKDSIKEKVLVLTAAKHMSPTK
jgi:hypothetical protein